MKVRLVGLAMLCALVLITSFSGSRSSYSQTTKSSLSPGEQELMNEINLARADPQKYASYLEKLKPLFNGKEYKTETLKVTTVEGWSAVEDAIKFLRAARPAAPLSMSSGLCLAALAHVKDQGGSGATGHQSGNKGGLVEDRVKPFGTWKGGIGENLTYGNESARERVLTWLIDDGFSTRGHRLRLMSPDYKVAGIGCGPHPDYNTMCVLTLAGNFVDASAAKSATSKPANTRGAAKNNPPNANLPVTKQSQSKSAAKNANIGTPETTSGAANSNKSKTAAKP
jgi:uncharacterized protein YkwD